MKLISIIIPVLNEAKMLRRLLTHLVNSIDIKTEIIVVGCEMTDDGSDLICREFNISFLKANKANRSVQMNTGARNAKGEIYCFLHADVLPDNLFIKHIREIIDNGYRFGFFSYKFEPTNTLLDINASFTAKDGIFSGGGDQIHFMEKSLFFETDGYDENLQIMEDFDFFRKIRILEIPYKITDAPAIVSSRKYFHNSYLKVNIANFVVFFLWKLGVSTEILKKIYRRLLKN